MLKKRTKTHYQIQAELKQPLVEKTPIKNEYYPPPPLQNNLLKPPLPPKPKKANKTK